MISHFKGWVGEKTAQLGIWLTLDNAIYRPFHNLILETNGATTQIDHVLLSRFGIFVIETKNYDGWIFGNETQKQWTQVLHGAKHAFQNPLHQNYRHTKALAETLDVDHGKIHSIVFFIGEAELKTPLPSNVLTRGLSSYIKRFGEIVFDEGELCRLGHELARRRQMSVSTKEHVRNLKERLSGEANCPKCGSALVKRLARSGSRAGSEFTGCSSFPRCRFVRS